MKVETGISEEVEIRGVDNGEPLVLEDWVNSLADEVRRFWVLLQEDGSVEKIMYGDLFDTDQVQHIREIQEQLLESPMLSHPEIEVFFHRLTLLRLQLLTSSKGKGKLNSSEVKGVLAPLNYSAEQLTFLLSDQSSEEVDQAVVSYLFSKRGPFAQLNARITKVPKNAKAKDQQEQAIEQAVKVMDGVMKLPDHKKRQLSDFLPSSLLELDFETFGHSEREQVREHIRSGEAAFPLTYDEYRLAFIHARDAGFGGLEGMKQAIYLSCHGRSELSKNARQEIDRRISEVVQAEQVKKTGKKNLELGPRPNEAMMVWIERCGYSDPSIRDGYEFQYEASNPEWAPEVITEKIGALKKLKQEQAQLAQLGEDLSQLRDYATQMKNNQKLATPLGKGNDRNGNVSSIFENVNKFNSISGNNRQMKVKLNERLTLQVAPLVVVLQKEYGEALTRLEILLGKEFDALKRPVTNGKQLKKEDLNTFIEELNDVAQFIGNDAQPSGEDYLSNSLEHRQNEINQKIEMHQRLLDTCPFGRALDLKRLAMVDEENLGVSPQERSEARSPKRFESKEEELKGAVTDGLTHGQKTAYRHKVNIYLEALHKLCEGMNNPSHQLQKELAKCKSNDERTRFVLGQLGNDIFGIKANGDRPTLGVVRGSFVEDWMGELLLAMVELSPTGKCEATNLEEDFKGGIDHKILLGNSGITVGVDSKARSISDEVTERRNNWRVVVSAGELLQTLDDDIEREVLEWFYRLGLPSNEERAEGSSDYQSLARLIEFYRLRYKELQPQESEEAVDQFAMSKSLELLFRLYRIMGKKMTEVVGELQNQTQDFQRDEAQQLASFFAIDLLGQTEDYPELSLQSHRRRHGSRATRAG